MHRNHSFIISRLPFFILAFEQNILQNITQRENTDEAEVVINHNQPVNPGLADGVKDSVKAVIDRAGIDSRKVLPAVSSLYRITESESLTGERFFNASPTLRFKSSYTPPLISVITSTASKTLYTMPEKENKSHDDHTMVGPVSYLLSLRLVRWIYCARRVCESRQLRVCPWMPLQCHDRYPAGSLSRASAAFAFPRR